MAQFSRRITITIVIIGLSAACNTHTPLNSPTQASPATQAYIEIQSTPTQTDTPTLTLETTAKPGASPTPASAAVTIPDTGNYTWNILTDGITSPTDIQSARDGSGRLFIVERPGRIRIFQDGKLAEAPFLDITNIAGSNGAEQGLLGLAFHPQFASNGYYYVNYTDKNGNTHISRFTATEDSTNTGSEQQILFVQQPFPNHNGGALAFGPDGYLYIGLGDGGSGGDPYGNAQSTNTLLGKILRVDVNHGEPYSAPVDNPYTITNSNYPEIWAIGLRNPWKFFFDQQTGNLWVADVGQDNWEELNFIPAGTNTRLNFGWNIMEANYPYSGSNQPEFWAPVAEYKHGPECSITGGVVYSGKNLPEWQGVYMFGDFCSGNIWGVSTPPQNNPPTLLFQTTFRISTFGLDEEGELLVADYAGSIYQLTRK